MTSSLHMCIVPDQDHNMSQDTKDSQRLHMGHRTASQLHPIRECVYASIFDNIITLLWSLMQHTTPTS